MPTTVRFTQTSIHAAMRANMQYDDVMIVVYLFQVNISDVSLNPFDVRKKGVKHFGFII